jgi:hypothetical protein
MLPPCGGMQNNIWMRYGLILLEGNPMNDGCGKNWVYLASNEIWMPPKDGTVICGCHLIIIFFRRRRWN